jgi:hypothetical protein
MEQEVKLDSPRLMQRRHTQLFTNNFRVLRDHAAARRVVAKIAAVEFRAFIVIDDKGNDFCKRLNLG